MVRDCLYMRRIDTILKLVTSVAIIAHSSEPIHTINIEDAPHGQSPSQPYSRGWTPKSGVSAFYLAATSVHTKPRRGRRRLSLCAVFTQA